MKRAGLVGLVIIVAAVGVWLARSRTSETPPSASAPAERTQRASETSRGSAAAPPARVVQVTHEQRTQIAERIAAAQAARAAHSATPRPSLPAPDTLDTNDLEHIQTDVLEALKQAIPFLAACYDVHAPEIAKSKGTVAALMTLTGDPDIGTVIDADQMFDGNHQPLPAALDACLRDTMQTLALPPLAQGDKVKLQYSFAFGND